MPQVEEEQQIRFTPAEWDQAAIQSRFGERYTYVAQELDILKEYHTRLTQQELSDKVNSLFYKAEAIQIRKEQEKRDEEYRALKANQEAMLEEMRTMQTQRNNQHEGVGTLGQQAAVVGHKSVKEIVDDHVELHPYHAAAAEIALAAHELGLEATVDTPRGKMHTPEDTAKIINRITSKKGLDWVTKAIFNNNTRVRDEARHTFL